MFDSFGGGDDKGAVGVGLRLAADASPGAAVARKIECVFRPAQKMVRKDGDPYVRSATLGELVVKWVQPQIAFHAPKGIFYSNKSDVEFP